MGDPRKTRKKFATPAHPWQRARIEEEKKLMESYGLTSKKEIWRMSTILKRFKDQAKKLTSRRDEQSKIEEKQLLKRLGSYGLVKGEDSLGTVLSLKIEDIFERRLQTLLVRKNLAHSMTQARQFVTHGHVMVDNKKITFPSHLVALSEESMIRFVPTSSLSNEEHPERAVKDSSKDKGGKKKDKKSEEVAPPTFAAEEIVSIDEKGVVEKKKAATEE